MPAAATPTNLSPAELSYLQTSLSQSPPIRPDSRLSTEFRPLRAETDILPSCNGSAHVSLADGSEAIVGVKAEVEKTAELRGAARLQGETGVQRDDEMEIDDLDSSVNNASRARGNPDWISLSVDISTLREDDPHLNFLSEVLREPLLTSSHSPSSSTSLADTLAINQTWHWHLFIDVLLISPFSASRGATSPLPLLSLATHLALRSTRLPRLKSQGEEDPLVDDDWESSVFLFPKPDLKGKGASTGEGGQLGRMMRTPPVTLLVMTVSENMIFDPSHAELAVADAVLAISVGWVDIGGSSGPRILSIRTLETPARDTMKGVPRTTSKGQDGQLVPGVWSPRAGGIKQQMLKNVTKAVLGDGREGNAGMAKEVLDGLEAFLRI